MITQTLPSSAPLSVTALFPHSEHGFFETFPRELRDKIYDLLYQEINGLVSSCDSRLTCPIPQLRLLSRQFKLEYDEKCLESKHLNQLLLKDMVPLFLRNSRLYCYEEAAARITSLIVVLDCCKSTWHTGICHFGYFLELYCKWLGKIVCNLHILPTCVYFKVAGNRCVEQALHSLEDATLEVQEVRVLHPGSEWDENGNNEVIATWTPARGLERDNEAIKQCLERVAAGQ